MILVVTCAEITIVMCYFQLCNEDYRWWWRSYLSAGSSGGYLFLYSIWYYFTKLHITGFTASALYFSYMAMVSLTFAMLTGDLEFPVCLCWSVIWLFYPSVAKFTLSVLHKVVCIVIIIVLSYSFECCYFPIPF